MKKIFVFILSMLLATSVFAETEKRVDGKRVETYKRVTVKDGSIVMTNSKTDADYAEGTAAADGTRYSDNLVTMTADPAASAEVSGGYFRVSKTNGSNGVYTINGLEGVAYSGYADEAGTFRGVYGRTYTNADATSTMRTSVGGEFSARASYAGGTECVAEAGTAFIGSRIWMAPYFSAASVNNINNFWGLWIYGEHATQRNADAAIKISTAGGGFTDDIILQSGDKLTNSAAGTIVASGALQTGKAGASGAVKIYSEQGANDYTMILSPNAAMSANTTLYLPAAVAGAESFLKMGNDGIIDYDTNAYATTTLNNLGVTALNASLLPGVAGAVNLGSEALFFGTVNLGTALVFEGATDNEYQTTLTAVDTTVSDKTINLPNADGTLAVSATAPVTLSALGDVGITVLKDIVTSSPLSGGSNDVLPGADSDLTLSIADAAADGSTKGASTYTALDFTAASGVISLNKTATLVGNPALGANNTEFASTGLIFEGSTNDDIETLLTVSDPTSADKTITLPDATDTLVGRATTDTLTNKRITPRITTIESNANPTINTDNCDAVTITAQAADIASMTTNLSGTPTNFQKLIIRIKDDGTARAITWGASFAARGVALPTTTVISKVLTVGFIYNTVTSTWDCIASAQEL